MSSFYNNTVKRLVPILLILLAVFYGAPHSACACSQATSVSAEQNTEHSCCGTQTSSQCTQASAHIGKVSSCCGILGNELPAVTSLTDLLGNAEQVPVKVSNQPVIAALPSFIVQGHESRVNRAPPGIRGFGSSDTYLFKRALLI
jgi:hypothetical protein